MKIKKGAQPMGTRSRLSRRLRRVGLHINLIATAFAFVAASLVPLVNAGTAHAAQLSSRSATISTSAPSSSGVQIIFGYTLPTSSAVQGLVYQFCTTPLGSCTAPGWTLTGFTQVGQSGFPANGTGFSAHGASDLGDCTQSTNATSMICFTRTSATAGTGAVTHTVGGLTTNATIQTVYIRISTYSDNVFTTGNLVDSGVVAVSINRQLTVSGRVQERLAFCVFAIDSAAATPANCGAAPTTTTVDIGVIDNSSIAQSPVANSPPTTFGNNMYGALEVNTNAQGGLGITYFAEAASTGTNELRSFRVSGATCSGSQPNLTDQCFVSASSAGVNFSAGTEKFGMYVPCVDQTVATTTNISTVTAAYTGTDASIASSSSCQTEAGNVKFAWNDTGTPQALASSTTVVDNEVVKLRFGATASATTPTGQYSVTSTYIATPTF
jgi:hypothetical protein